MSGAAADRDAAVSSAAGSAPAASRPLPVEARRRLVAGSLQVGNPGSHSGDLQRGTETRPECQIELPVEDIRPYEHNPRRVGNARLAQIKESIRASGIRNPLTVTRRPGESHFILESGGNTRLYAIQQLWRETGEARFRTLAVLFRPWRSESHVLAAHLIENELRGEMTFWDKAGGIAELKSRLETEQGRTFSLRQLEEAMKEQGFSINIATLGHCLFAVGRLQTLGAGIADLSGLDVKLMQPRFNAMRRYAQARASLAEDALYATVFEPVFMQAAEQYRQSQRFNALAVCRACEEALARRLAEPVEHLRDALAPTAHPGSAQAVSPSSWGRVSRTRHTSGPESESGVAASPSAGPSRLTGQARELAGLAGLAGCLSLDTHAPSGYCMRGLATAGTASPADPLRQRVWWLLVLASGQCGEHDASAGPRGSAVQETGLLAADQEPAAAPSPCVFDDAFFDWITDATNRTASACWDFLALVRASRRPAPQQCRGHVAAAAGGER